MWIRRNAPPREPPRVKIEEYADVVELVDSLDLGSNARACRFESCHPHQTNIIRTRFSELEMGSDYLFISPVTSKSISPMVPPSWQVPNPGGHERRKPDKQNEQPQRLFAALTPKAALHLLLLLQIKQGLPFEPNQ